MIDGLRDGTKLIPLARALVGVAVIGAAAWVTLACTKDSAAATGGPSSHATHVAVGPHADGDHFSVDGAPVGTCAAGSECSVTLKVTVRDEYHVNTEYPHKFTADDAAGVEFLGKDAAKKNVFSKRAGDFVITDAKSAVLTVRFKSQAGSPTISGTLKLGVCSEQNCILPQVQIAVPVTVK